MLEWIRHLKLHANNNRGYQLVEKETSYQNIGKNTIPTHIKVDSLDELMSIIDIKKEYELFVINSQILLSSYPILEQWIIKYPFKVIEKINGDGNKYVMTLKWLETNDLSELYIRQFDIQGVDTKFIESNKPLLKELLDLILSSERINTDFSNFEARFNIKAKPNLIRFRILDNEATNPFTDMSVPIDQFKLWQPHYEYFFLVENEINFLTFPNLKNSCVIFAKGYNVEVLNSVKWLQDKKTYYWGDIDTHGYNILSRVRTFLPTIESILMDEHTLITHKHLWVTEQKPFLQTINLLTVDENEVLINLQKMVYGEKVRLEQERIDYHYVQATINKLDISLVDKPKLVVR